MGSVTGYTAERIQQIEDQAIVGAEVIGDDLWMARNDTSTFNAGSVRGPEGPQGPTGDVTLTQLNNAVDSLIEDGTYAPHQDGWALGTGAGFSNNAVYVYVGGPNTGDKGHLMANGYMSYGSVGVVKAYGTSCYLGLPPGFHVHAQQPFSYRMCGGYWCSIGADWSGNIFAHLSHLDEVRIQIPLSSDIPATGNDPVPGDRIEWAIYGLPVIRV